MCRCLDTIFLCIYMVLNHKYVMGIYCLAFPLLHKNTFNTKLKFANSYHVSIMHYAQHGSISKLFGTKDGVFTLHSYLQKTLFFYQIVAKCIKTGLISFKHILYNRGNFIPTIPYITIVITYIV